MLISGAEKLEKMRDGRRVLIGKERVGDVTVHPAFKNAAQTVADLYDQKADPDKRDLYAFEEDGEAFSVYWLRCKNREELARRTASAKALADATYGVIGRSPDHVAGLVTGLAMNPGVLEKTGKGFGDNLLRYYQKARHEDLFLSFAVTAPSGIRGQEVATGDAGLEQPALRVVAEDDDGVVVSGMKMLATGAVFADEIWIGNLSPIDESRKAESITAAMPLNLPGLSLWARQPYEMHAARPANYPLSHRFDEGDCMLVCENVKIPWERVFLHNDGAQSRQIYIDTPANCYANHQSNVRFWAKMGLMVGLASRACLANGIDQIPAVRDILGRLAALEATVGGLVAGQNEAWEAWPESPDGYATHNRRIMYATLNWCQEHHTEIVDIVRDLMGAAPLQMPASTDILDDPELSARFDEWWATPTMDARQRMKLYKLGWDLTGSEFAGRHQLYEKFYAGSSLIVRNSCHREAPWDHFHAIVDDLLDEIEF